MSSPTVQHPDEAGGHVLFVVLRARPGRADQVLDRLHELAAVSLGGPGCRQYRVHRDAADPDAFALYEEWEDEPVWRRHDSEPRVVDLLAALTPDLAEPIVVRRLLPV